MFISAKPLSPLYRNQLSYGDIPVHHRGIENLNSIRESNDETIGPKQEPCILHDCLPAILEALFTSPAPLVAQNAAAQNAQNTAQNQNKDKYATAEELGLMKGFPPPPDKRVTRANALLTAPFNRWSYLHMRKIFPSAPIQPAEASAKPAEPSEAGTTAITAPWGWTTSRSRTLIPAR